MIIFHQLFHPQRRLGSNFWLFEKTYYLRLRPQRIVVSEINYHSNLKGLIFKWNLQECLGSTTRGFVLAITVVSAGMRLEEWNLFFSSSMSLEPSSLWSSITTFKGISICCYRPLKFLYDFFFTFKGSETHPLTSEFPCPPLAWRLVPSRFVHLNQMWTPLAGLLVTRRTCMLECFPPLFPLWWVSSQIALRVIVEYIR